MTRNGGPDLSARPTRQGEGKRMTDQLITTGEAAQVYGCHRSLIDQFIRNGKLAVATLKSGTRRYVRKSDVEALAKNKRQPEQWTKTPGRPRREETASQ